MKCSIPLAFAAAMLVGGHSPAQGDKPSPGKSFQFTIREFEGDPLGSLEAGTLKVRSGPRVATLEDRPFAYSSGGEMAVPESSKGVWFGRMIEGKAGALKDGKVRLDITLSNTTGGEKTAGHIQLHTESTRTIATVRLGEVVKIRWGKGSADKKAWIELSVHAMDP